MRILTFGTFDSLHPGHLSYLEQASQLGELFIVVARDANVLKIKNRAPLENEEQRKAAIEAAFPEAAVMLGDPDDFLQPLHQVKPDLIFLGYDQKLPPGVTEAHLPCPAKRAEAFEPERYKSSLRRNQK
jgi:FAD synthetase